jgi:hypothetical protein
MKGGLASGLHQRGQRCGIDIWLKLQNESLLPSYGFANIRAPLGSVGFITTTIDIKMTSVIAIMGSWLHVYLEAASLKERNILGRITCIPFFLAKNWFLFILVLISRTTKLAK